MKKSAILIDAKNRTVSGVEVDGRESIKALIGCDKFTVAQEWPDDHTLFVDDAGWLPTKEAPRHSFCICPFPGARYEHLEFAGNGLLVRFDYGGDYQDGAIDVIDVLPFCLGYMEKAIEFPDEEITNEKRAAKLADGIKMIEIKEGKL